MPHVLKLVLMTMVGMALHLGLAPAPGASGQQTASGPLHATWVSADTTEADTAGVAADTTERRPREQREAAPPVPVGDLLDFVPAPTGPALADSVYERRPYPTIAENLAEHPGSFLYHLGPEGWPHGWSPYGLSPLNTELWIDDRRYTDPLTQQPRHDLLAPLLTTRPHHGLHGQQAPVALHQHWRSFTETRPLTELRYRRGGGDLQAVEVAHTQGHDVTVLGRPARIHATFGYGGRSTVDTYSSSEIDIERQVLLRVRYQQPRWAVELSNYSVRHRMATHGGVEPVTPDVPATLFAPGVASVRNAGQRQTIRNDLTMRLQGQWSRNQPPLRLTGGWTSNTFDYTEADKTTFFSDVWTATLRQSITWQGHHLQGTAYVEERTATLRDTADTAQPTITHRRIGLRDSVTVGKTSLDARAQLQQVNTLTPSPTGALHVTRPLGPIALHAHASSTVRLPSRLERDGFLDFVTPIEEAVRSRTNHLRMGAEAEAGVWQARIEGFANQLVDAVEWERGSNPSESQVVVIPGALNMVGGTAELRWRYASERGLYALAQATTVEVLNSTASQQHFKYAESLPQFFGRGRIGARFLLFQDLDVDLYVEGTGWSTFRSRWFHAPTGQLTLPALEAPATPGTPPVVTEDGVMNVHAEMDLRGAKLMLSFENALGGTDVSPGTYMVPTFPLPNQRFRFSIHWPLFD